MWNETVGWMRDVAEDFRRQALVGKLGRLSDHLLEDIGLRRDQLDLLRLPAQKPPAEVFDAPPRAVRPSLQGCG